MHAFDMNSYFCIIGGCIHRCWFKCKLCNIKKRVISITEVITNIFKIDMLQCTVTRVTIYYTLLRRLLLASQKSNIFAVASTSPILTRQLGNPPERPPYQQCSMSFKTQDSTGASGQSQYVHVVVRD